MRWTKFLSKYLLTNPIGLSRLKFSIQFPLDNQYYKKNCGLINLIQIYTIKLVKTLPQNTNRCLETFKRPFVLQIVW